MANHLIAVFVVSGKIRGLGRYVRFCPLSFADNNVIITLNKYTLLSLLKHKFAFISTKSSLRNNHAELALLALLCSDWYIKAF